MRAIFDPWSRHRNNMSTFSFETLLTNVNSTINNYN